MRQLTTLVKEAGNATHPEWSRDGRSVMFAATMSGDGRTVLALVDASGGVVGSATGTDWIEGTHPRYRPVP